MNEMKTAFDRMRDRALEAERKLKQTCAEKVRRENELCAQIGGLHEESERMRERAEEAERERDELRAALRNGLCPVTAVPHTYDDCERSEGCECWIGRMLQRGAG